MDLEAGAAIQRGRDKKGKRDPITLTHRSGGHMPRPASIKNYLNVKPRDPFPGGGKVAVLIDSSKCGNRVRAELVDLRPTEAFPLHVHPKSDHVIIVVRGNGHLSWEENEREIIVGDTFVVPMGKVHSIRAGNNDGLRFVVINVPPVEFDDKYFMKTVDPKLRRKP